MLEHQQVQSVTDIQHICTHKKADLSRRLRPEQHSEGWVFVPGAPQHPVWKSCLRGTGTARSQEVRAQSGCLVCVSDKVSDGWFQIANCILHWYFPNMLYRTDNIGEWSSEFQVKTFFSPYGINQMRFLYMLNVNVALVGLCVQRREHVCHADRKPPLHRGAL